jgi:hypothetical protein
LIKSLLTSVDVKVRVGWSIIRIRDTSESGDLTSASLFVKSFNITAFANFKGSTDVAFEEFKTRSSVKILGSITILGVWANEGNEDNNTCQVEELGDFSDSADVLGTIFRGEGEALVETSTNNISVKDVNFGCIS